MSAPDNSFLQCKTTDKSWWIFTIILSGFISLFLLTTPKVIIGISGKVIGGFSLAYSIIALITLIVCLYT